MAGDDTQVTVQKQRRRVIGNPDKIIPYRYKPGQSGNPSGPSSGAFIASAQAIKPVPVPLAAASTRVVTRLFHAVLRIFVCSGLLCRSSSILTRIRISPAASARLRPVW